MGTREFYIRNTDEDEARGPFTFETLSAMIAGGSVAPDTLYFDGATENWTPLSACPEAAPLFPAPPRQPADAPPKLRLKTKSNVPSVNETADAQSRGISIRELLAAPGAEAAKNAPPRAPLRLSAAVIALTAAALAGARPGLPTAAPAAQLLREPSLWLAALLAASVPFVWRGTPAAARNTAAFGLGAGALLLASRGGAAAAALLALAFAGVLAGSFTRGRAACLAPAAALLPSALACAGLWSRIL
ncbi:MAG: DUF4339 domain-containing protein [Opitutaceae bacterium]|jgi:hypothetical protein|nr:DUF4339 domain-containing protein [Opitutaceae bacterium]